MRIEQHQYVTRGNPWEQTVTLTEQTFPLIISAVLTETLAYGIHVVLYTISSVVLLRKGGRLQVMSFIATSIMFGLATADIGVSYNILLRRTADIAAGKNSALLLALLYPKFLISLVNNLIADSLLIIRCFVIWGNNKALAFAAAFLLLAATVVGFVGEGTTSPKLKVLVGPYICINFVLNIGLTLITAGRIWWVAREVSKIMGRAVVQPFNLAVAILLESGIIYTGTLITLLSLSPTNYVLIAAAINVRMVCIMPIFIVVMVALGRGTKDLETTMSQARSQTRGVELSTVIQFRTSPERELNESNRNDA